MEAVLRAAGHFPFLTADDAEAYGGTVLSPTAAERAARGREEDDGRLKKRIAELYDESSGLWERLWGDHMHHGFYEPGATASAADHRAAQVKMIEEALGFAEITGFSSSLSLSLLLLR